MNRPGDRPWLLHAEAARLGRRAELTAPHIAPLTAFVQRLRTATGVERDIPDFDPWDGGVEAECLFLLEAPGPQAVASGFVSRNNPDVSARNFFDLNTEAGIARERTVAWNIVPWYIGTGARIRAATRSDIAAGLGHLGELLDLLPRLRAIVLVGRKAQAAQPTVRSLRPSQTVFLVPHPSPKFVNRRPGNREVLLGKLREIATFLNQP
jgi:uracil-DNA glycosylase